MQSMLFGLGFTCVTALIVIAGDFVLKLAADGQKPALSGLVAGGATLYALSAVFWFFAMRHVTLAQAGVAYSMITLLALCVIGVVYFDEALAAREYLGILCALAAMVLLMRVA